MQAQRNTLLSLGLVVFFSVVLVSVPFINGYFFKKSYLRLMAASNSPVQLSVVEYHLGWFSSEAKLAISVDATKINRIRKKSYQEMSDNLNDLSKKILIEQHISHGPFVKNPATNTWEYDRALIVTNIHIPKKQEDLLLKSANGIMQITTYVSYDNLYRHYVHMPIISVSKDGQAKLTWDGINGEVDTQVADNTVTALTSDLKLGALGAGNDTRSITMGNILLKGHINCPLTSALCEGASDFSFPSFIAHTPDANFDLSLLKMTNQYGLTNNNTYDYHWDFTLARLLLPKASIGPVNFEITVKNLNPEGLAKLKNAYTQMNQAVREGSDYDAESLLFVAHLNADFPSVVAPTTAISEKLTVESSYGNLGINADYSWPAGMPLPKSSMEIVKGSNLHVSFHVSATLMEQWIKLLDEEKAKRSTALALRSAVSQPGGVTVAAPLPVANPASPNVVSDTRKNVDKAIQKGFLIKDADGYSGVITFEASVLKINDIVVPLKDLH
jgi:uncharacterized protein YdgA (DUF945 family)